MSIRFVFLLMGLVFGADVIAQVPVRVPAGNIRRPRIMLTQLVRAKLHTKGDQTQLILMLESYRTEIGTGLVTEIRQEQRTRMVVKEGKPVEQTYIVSVPITKQVENAELSVPAGIKPATFDPSKFEFYDLSGTPMSAELAKTRLAKLSAVFLIDNYQGGVEGMPEIQQQAMHPNCLIVTSADKVRVRPAAVRPIPAAR